jgi:hypothetical protein
MVYWLFVISALVASIASNAVPLESSVLHPKLPNMDNLPSTLTSPPTSKIFLGKLAVEFEHTTLNEIKNSVGVGVVQHRGDAGGSEDWLCYTTSSRGRSERIWISSGELGGTEHVVDRFYVELDKQAGKGLMHCPKLPTQFRHVSLENSLWLGADIGQLKVLFGEPSARIDDWLLYSYSGKVRVNGFDRLAILGVRVCNGIVIGLYMSQVSTN